MTGKVGGVAAQEAQPCLGAQGLLRGDCGVWNPGVTKLSDSVSSPPQAEPMHGPRPPAGHSPGTDTPSGPEQVNKTLAG